MSPAGENTHSRTCHEPKITLKAYTKKVVQISHEAIKLNMVGNEKKYLEINSSCSALVMMRCTRTPFSKPSNNFISSGEKQSSQTSKSSDPNQI